VDVCFRAHYGLRSDIAGGPKSTTNGLLRRNRQDRYSITSSRRRRGAAGMIEAAKGFRRLKAHKQLPILQAALLAHQAKHAIGSNLEPHTEAA
jgi:putative transposase